MDGRFSYQVPRDAERRWLGLVAFTEVGGQRVESSPMPLDKLIGGSDLKLTVRRGESIAGVVHSADGVPAGCQVTLAYTGHAPPRAMGGENDAFVPHVYQAHWVETTRAGAEGAFRFGGLPRGTFELRAALEGFASAPRSLRLTGAGTTTSTELTLVGAGSISVSIAVKEGVPVMIADAWYRPVHGESRELPICPVSGSSPGDGEGSTGPIPAGTYRVWWSTGDGAGFESTEVNVQRGFSTQLRISDSSGLAIDYVSEAALK